jgi:hypothetical protein
MRLAMEIKDIVKHGVEHSSTPVSKAPQGSKKHKTDVLQYIEKMKDMYEPKLADQKIFKNNINNKPTYPTQATPEMMGKAAERIERARQMTGEPKQLSTWDLLKKAADTPEEKKEIREIIREDYKKNGAKNMDPDDLKWIGKGKVATDVKIDVSGISESINNYINATAQPAPLAPPKKQRDPDLDAGIVSVLGGSNEY